MTTKWTNVTICIVRRLYRWLVPAALFVIGAAVLSLPDVGLQNDTRDTTEHGDIPHGQYIFGGLLIFCSIVCALPSAVRRRAIAAGCTTFCLVLAGFIIKQMFAEHSTMGRIDALEGLIPVCAIGAGTAVYAITGGFPTWLSVILHARSRNGNTTRHARPAEHIEEDRRHCPQCLSETWHVARTFSDGERVVECESCGRSINEPVEL